MTTSLPHTHIRLRDLSELVGGIPHVLGYPPTDSLVLFTFRRCPDLVLSTTIRVDLPNPEHVPLLVSELADAVARNGVVAAIAVVVGEKGPEQHDFIEALRLTLADTNTLLTHASWVRKVAEGEQWQCYDEPLCTGTVPDPHTSVLAAATAVAGGTVYSSRKALAEQLAPDAPEALAHRKNLIDAYRSAGSHSEVDARADLETLGHALDKVTSSRALPTFTDHELARLGVALSRQEVRDACMAIAISDTPQPAERLWTVLTRALPAPERATAAFLLAISSYLRGSGLIAALALNITMAADPNHKTAAALDHALQKGTPPSVLRTMIDASITRNHEDATTPPPDDDPPWDTTPAEKKHPMKQRDDRDLASTEQPAQPPPTSPAGPALIHPIPGDDNPDEAQALPWTVPSTEPPSASRALPALAHPFPGDGDPAEAQTGPWAVPPAEPSSASRALPALTRVVPGDGNPDEAKAQPWTIPSAVSISDPAIQDDADLSEAQSQRSRISRASAVWESTVRDDADVGETLPQPLAFSRASVSKPAVHDNADFSEALPQRLPVLQASSALERAVRGAMPRRVVASPTSSVLEHDDRDGESGAARTQRPVDHPAPSVLGRGVAGLGVALPQRVVVNRASDDVHPSGAEPRADRDPVPVDSTASDTAGPARVVPGPLSQRAATALGIPADRVVVMDPLTAFLPPPTEQSDPS